MRLEVTLKTDIAVRCLRALRDGGQMKASELADAVGSTAGFITQVLNPLVKARWVRSVPGPNGGYALQNRLEDIAVLELIEAVEGPVDTGRSAIVGECAEAGPCAVHDAWVRARNVLVHELRAKSVADVRNPSMRPRTEHP